MAHLLKDCEDLLKQAWKEVEFKQLSMSQRKDKLRTYLSDLENSFKNDLEVFAVYQNLVVILQDKEKTGRIQGWKSCEQMYTSLIMLMNSDYERYEFLEIGEAKRFLEKAIPLYCKLARCEPPILKEKKKDSLQDKLLNGSILDDINNDIDGIRVFSDKSYYRQFLNSNINFLVIAFKGNYEIHVVLKSISLHGIDIDNTKYRLRVVNTKTKKELKVGAYSDIKKIFDRA